MTTTTDAVNTQVETTTGENIFNQGSDMQSCQQDWHTPMQTPPTIIHIHAAEGTAITKTSKILDNQSKNWSAWSQSMVLLFKLFKVQDYVQGKVTCPDPHDDPEGAENWGYNDTFAQLLITSNITPSERVHTNGCPMSNHMWLSLQSMHESTSHLILTTHLCTLMNTTAAEGNNIIEHISKLKQCWDQLSLFGDTNYHVSKFLFKQIIASSLPESWDQYTDQFIAGQLDFVDTDPKKNIDNQQFIGILKQEYEWQESRKPRATKSSEQALIAYGCDNARPPLASQISGNMYNQNRTLPPQMHCRICRLTNHYMRNCQFKGKLKCMTCGRFRHKTKDYRNAGTGERAHDNDGRGNRYNVNKRPQREANNASSSIVEVNAAKEEEHIAFIANTADDNNMDMDTDTYDDAKYHNFEHVPSSTEMDLRLIYYDWLANTGATSHITHQRDTFTTYERISEVPISGVGKLKACMVGIGNVKLISEYNGHTYVLELQNILHVPNNRNNLMSLG